MVRSNALVREYANGSRILGLPKGRNQVRSLHPFLYLADEAAFLEEFRECVSAVQPVAKQIIAISTANPGPFGDECVREFYVAESSAPFGPRPDPFSEPAPAPEPEKTPEQVEEDFLSRTLNPVTPQLEYFVRKRDEEQLRHRGRIMGNTLQEIFARLSGKGQDMPPDMQNALETPDLGPGGGVALGGTGGGGRAPPGFKGAPLPRRGGLTQQQIQLPGGGFETESQAQNQVPDTSGLTLDTTSTPSSIHQPGFLSALTSAPPGTPVTANPQLSTKGKVLAALVGIGQGALAGYAAGQQGNPRQGYGGFGAGFDAGSQLSFIQSYRRQQQQEAQLQQKIQQWKLEQEQQNQPIQRQQQAATLAQTQASTQKDIQQTQNLANAPDKLPDLQHLYAQAVQSGNMAQAQKYADAIQAIQKEPTPKTPNRDDEAIRIQGKYPKSRTQPEKDLHARLQRLGAGDQGAAGHGAGEVFVQGRAVQTEDPGDGREVLRACGRSHEGRFYSWKHQSSKECFHSRCPYQGCGAG